MALQQQQQQQQQQRPRLRCVQSPTMAFLPLQRQWEARWTHRLRTSRLASGSSCMAQQASNGGAKAGEEAPRPEGLTPKELGPAPRPGALTHRELKPAGLHGPLQGRTHLAHPPRQPTHQPLLPSPGLLLALPLPTQPSRPTQLSLHSHLCPASLAQTTPVLLRLHIGKLCWAAAVGLATASQVGGPGRAGETSRVCPCYNTPAHRPPFRKQSHQLFVPSTTPRVRLRQGGPCQQQALTRRLFVPSATPRVRLPQGSPCRQQALARRHTSWPNSKETFRSHWAGKGIVWRQQSSRAGL